MMNDPTGSGGRFRVLVVGHHIDELVAFVGRSKSNPKSLHLVRAPWAEDAVDGIRTGTADAVAVVVGLPGEGLADLSSVRESEPSAPLVALLRDFDHDLALAAIGAGADEVIPLREHDAMVMAVERALARSRARTARAPARGTQPVSLLGAATARIRLAELVEPVLEVRDRLRALDLARQQQPGATESVPDAWARLRDDAIASLDRLEQAVATSAPRRPERAKAKAPRPQGEDRRGRLLLVDDDPMVLYALTELLSPRHEVVAAGSGTEALRILSEDGQFDAVVCDVVMPDIDGVGVLQFLETHHPELAERLIFCTGGDFEPSTARVIAGGATPIVPKTSLRLLHETIRRVVWESTELRSKSDQSLRTM